MVISSNGKTITPDTQDELTADLSNIIRYFIVYRQLTESERKELASTLLNTVLLSCLWSDLDKEKISNFNSMDSMIYASCYYTETFLNEFGKEK